MPVVDKPLDCFQPITLDVWPPFNLFPFLSGLGHRAEDTTDAGIALVIKFAMWYAILVQELPHVALRPVDDGRNEYLVPSTDTGDHLLLVLAPLVKGFFHALSLYAGGYFLAFSTPCAFLLPNAN